MGSLGEEEATGKAGGLDLLPLSPSSCSCVKRSACRFDCPSVGVCRAVGACYSPAAAACPGSHFEPLCVLRAALGSKDTAVRSVAPSLVTLGFHHPYGSPRGNIRQAILPSTRFKTRER